MSKEAQENQANPSSSNPNGEAKKSKDDVKDADFEVVD